MRALLTELLLLLFLVLVNGLFAMSEAAVIASRRARLIHLSRRGNRRAAAALSLAEQPTPFLSTVQVGITLFGIIAGAYGGATLAGELRGLLMAVPFLAPVASETSFTLVVLLITYLSLVVGELVPKRIALSNPEYVASLVAGPMRRLSQLARPAVRILTWSTEACIRLLRIRSTNGSRITEDEIRVMIDEGREAGILEQTEQDMVERVLVLGDRRVSQFMIPRPGIVWLDVSDSSETIREKLERAPYSRVPVCRGDLDNVVGIVQAKDLLIGVLSGAGLSLSASARQPLFIPDSMTALKVLEEFQRKGTHAAVVVDEHGGTTGLVTVNDIAAAIVGDPSSSEDEPTPMAVRRPDGSWLVDGRLSMDDLWTHLDIEPPLSRDRIPYETVGGLLMYMLGRVPREADTVDLPTVRLEVVDMDGNRVDKVLVSRRPGALKR